MADVCHITTPSLPIPVQQETTTTITTATPKPSPAQPEVEQTPMNQNAADDVSPCDNEEGVERVESRRVELAGIGSQPNSPPLPSPFARANGSLLQPDWAAEVDEALVLSPAVYDSGNAVMSLLIRYAHIPFFFAFPSLSLHHQSTTMHLCSNAIALALSDRSRLFNGHMTYDSHVFTSILSVSNMPPPAVQPITSSRTVQSGTFYSFAICSHSCLPFVFNLPVFTFHGRTSSPKP